MIFYFDIFSSTTQDQHFFILKYLKNWNDGINKIKCENTMGSSVQQ